MTGLRQKALHICYSIYVNIYLPAPTTRLYTPASVGLELSAVCFVQSALGGWTDVICLSLIQKVCIIRGLIQKDVRHGSGDWGLRVNPTSKRNETFIVLREKTGGPSGLRSYGVSVFVRPL